MLEDPSITSFDSSVDGHKVDTLVGFIAMATTRRSGSIVVLIVLVAAMMNVCGTNANIAEYDEYWTNKAMLSRRATMEAYHPDPYNVTNHLNHHVQLAMKGSSTGNNTRRGMAEKYSGPCLATNPIDKCWRCTGDNHWEDNRQHMADCVLGFARGTTGGKGGRYYVVNDSSDNDMVNPVPGTLRHAVIQEEPLWIIFDRPMIIRLNQEMMMASNKTIDARGANIHIAYGAGITIQFIENVIIHGLHIHDIVPSSGGLIRDSTSHYGLRTKSDGDGISIFGSSRIWIDHLSLARCSDGLIDAIQGSTAITISNNHLADHDHVFLFGAQDDYSEDKKMQITVAFNNFGKGLVQRMPRCRWGFFHVVNNDYTHWLMYAIGGTQQSTIISQGNRFHAPYMIESKEVTKRGRTPLSEWKTWTWRSENDLFINGAYFRQSGSPLKNNPYSEKMVPAMPGKHVRDLARFAGPTKCRANKEC